MRIAYIVPYVPNLIRTRPYNFILQLVDLGHKVEVFTLGSNEQDHADIQTLRNKGAIVHYFELPVWRSLVNSALAVPGWQPLQTVYSWHAGLAHQIAERAADKDFDVVHVEHLRGSRYGLYLKSRIASQPVVWDSVDCISHLFEQASSQSRNWFGRFVTRFELPRTRRAEGQLICSFDQALVTSAADREALLRLLPAGKYPAPISVLPNGVDLDYFHPNPDIERDAGMIVFSGKMSYHANISMAKYLVGEIMPLVWRSRPDAKLFIVGKDPTTEVIGLGQNHLITVTGTVSDIRPYLWRAAVSVVPLLYGAGIQNKILEAMATATPVITSPRAITALRIVPGKDLSVADNAVEFSQQILRLIDDFDLMKQIGGAGEVYVRKHHNWRSITLQLLDIYMKVITSSATASRL